MPLGTIASSNYDHWVRLSGALAEADGNVESLGGMLGHKTLDIVIVVSIENVRRR